jgi:hypothetical protein
MRTGNNMTPITAIGMISELLGTMSKAWAASAMINRYSNGSAYCSIGWKGYIASCENQPWGDDLPGLLHFHHSVGKGNQGRNECGAFQPLTAYSNNGQDQEADDHHPGQHTYVTGHGYEYEKDHDSDP